MTISVKFTLIPLVAALLFVDTLAIAADTSPQAPRNTGSNAVANRQATPASAGNAPKNNFLTSLRFWEKNKSSGHSQPLRDTRPAQETPTATRNVSSGQQDSPAAQRSTAPDPPAIPITEQRAGLGNAPLPEWSVNYAYDTDEKDVLAAQATGQPGRASHVSYSFDTRDWIESFPFQHEVREGTLAAMQSTSLRSPPSNMLEPLSPPPNVAEPLSLPPNTAVSLSPPPNVTEPFSPPPSVAEPLSLPPSTTVSLSPSPNAAEPLSLPPNNAEPFSPPQARNDAQNRDDESSFWDGQATKLATVASIRNEINLLQQDSVSRTTVPSAAVPVERAQQIDLSPSYQERLQYTQTCGVVVVQANFPLTEIASILDEIDMLQHDLMRYAGVSAPQEKIELCLFDDQRSYLDFLSEFFPKAPRDRRALFVKLDNKPGTLMVQKSKDFEVDLRHEMTHAIVHASIPRVPIWLDEGLAKYFEVSPQDRANNHPYMDNIRFNARLGMIPSLDRLSKLETIDDMATKEYRESWAWTHFLIHRSPETHRLLAVYLQMLAKYPEMESSYSGSGSDSGFLGGKLFGASASGVREKTAKIPSLSRYLDGIIPNQREAFREHFGVKER